MNIFVLDPSPEIAARQHCDKHICKMILEYGQMLSTAHRLLDGELITAVDEHDRRKPKKFWVFPGEKPYLNADLDEDGFWVYKWTLLNSVCYNVAHAQHPCSVWTRASASNYQWLYALFSECLAEYTRRYGRTHGAERIKEFLSNIPKNIPPGPPTLFAQAMPEEYKHEDAVQAYRDFYAGSKARFARWTNTEVPAWFLKSFEGKDVSIFSRTR